MGRERDGVSWHIALHSYEGTSLCLRWGEDFYMESRRYDFSLFNDLVEIDHSHVNAWLDKILLNGTSTTVAPIYLTLIICLVYNPDASFNAPWHSSSVQTPSQNAS